MISSSQMHVLLNSFSFSLPQVFLIFFKTSIYSIEEKSKKVPGFTSSALH